MHEPPQWTRTASDAAIITRDELLTWLDVETAQLRKLIKLKGFPPPRLVGAHNVANILSSNSRWRFGDVRAWLNGGDVAAETAKPMVSRASIGISHIKFKPVKKAVDADHHNGDIVEPSTTIGAQT